MWGWVSGEVDPVELRQNLSPDSEGPVDKTSLLYIIHYFLKRCRFVNLSSHHATTWRDQSSMLVRHRCSQAWIHLSVLRISKHQKLIAPGKVVQQCRIKWPPGSSSLMRMPESSKHQTRETLTDGFYNHCLLHRWEVRCWRRKGHQIPLHHKPWGSQGPLIVSWALDPGMAVPGSNWGGKTTTGLTLELPQEDAQGWDIRHWWGQSKMSWQAQQIHMSVASKFHRAF